MFEFGWNIYEKSHDSACLTAGKIRRLNVPALPSVHASRCTRLGGIPGAAPRPIGIAGHSGVQAKIRIHYPSLDPSGVTGLEKLVVEDRVLAPPQDSLKQPLVALLF